MKKRKVQPIKGTKQINRKCPEEAQILDLLDKDFKNNHLKDVQRAKGRRRQKQKNV